MSNQLSSAKSAEYSYENLNRPLTPYELKTVSEVTVWHEYVRLKQSPSPNVALQELLRRHDSILRKMVSSLQSKYSLTSELEDKLQHARIGAMRAYDKFDCEKSRESGAKLSTFVQVKAYNYVLDTNDTDSFIKCLPVHRKMRSYLLGNYDHLPQKLTQVEKDLQIASDVDRNEARAKYSNLIAKFSHWDSVRLGMSGRYSYDESIDEHEIYGGSHDSQDDIISKIQLQNHLSCLSERQKIVIELFIQGVYMHQIASELGVDEDTVRLDLRKIRALMKKRLLADTSICV